MKKFFKKAFKKLKKIVKPVGKALKTGLGSVSEALGPVGTLALSLMLPGIGAAFAGFTAAAATTGGLLGTVMQGIAAAGNAVGTVYSTVSSMVGGVIKAIPGVGDAYTKLANFTAQTMDKGRMALGLPTSSTTTVAGTVASNNAAVTEDKLNFVDTDAIRKDPTSLLEPTIKQDTFDINYNLPETKFDTDVNVDYRTPSERLGTEESVGRVDVSAKQSSYSDTNFNARINKLTQTDFDVMGIDTKSEIPFTQKEMDTINNFVIDSPPPSVVEQIDSSGTGGTSGTSDTGSSVDTYTKPSYAVTKPTMKVQSGVDFINSQDSTEFIDIYENMETYQQPVGESYVDRMEGTKRQVRRDSLTDERIKFYENRNNEFNYFNKQADKVIADATITTTDATGKITSSEINPEYTDFNKSMVGVKRGAALAAAGEGLATVAATPEEAYAGGVATPILETDITGATDYSQAYASAFQGAGYVGPNDFNSYTNAGYYGGDPFSIAQYNRRVATPQANIRIGG